MPAAYRATLAEFRSDDADGVVGRLSTASAAGGHGSIQGDQIGAWSIQVDTLRSAADELIRRIPQSAGWTILLEYSIPRRYTRPDAVLLADDLIFVIEFKVGATTFDAGARWQVEAYSRDLRDFHAESQSRTIVPVLVATDADSGATTPRSVFDPTQDVRCASSSSLVRILEDEFQASHRPDATQIDATSWDQSAYLPTLNILESAEALFSNHDVREISHCYADNLGATTERLMEVIRFSRTNRRRTICFVTGVPGAGKTLAGLNAVHNPEIRHGSQPAGVFLSGNVPLVRVVREALVRAAVRRRELRREAERRAKTYIQDVHRFLGGQAEPVTGNEYEHVVVFDEAQRAWDADKCERHERAKASEAELMLDIMSRRPNWCVIVALVGGGQEIHDGEAGLPEWGRALATSKIEWDVWASHEVSSSRVNDSPEFTLFDDGIPPNIRFHDDPLLHLGVNVRSHRAQTLSEWVRLLLMGRAPEAREMAKRISNFPFAFTRDLTVSRNWLRRFCQPDRRAGLVASSGARRLRAYGLELESFFRGKLKYQDWFLNARGDFRSSCSLEVALTEFELQGLELDYVGVCWGNDFWYSADEQLWKYQKLSGARLTGVSKPRDCDYIRNRYRVLLTRAREGMIIWVPRGDDGDGTLDPKTFDGTANFLKSAGMREFSAADL